MDGKGGSIMVDLFVYKCLEKINDVSTKITSWSWFKLWGNRKKGYGYKKRKK
tara:strand:+ start:470 stop:625 length:156 start_codon:yes stop_codon:yes gene_type:complete